MSCKSLSLIDSVSQKRNRLPWDAKRNRAVTLAVSRPLDGSGIRGRPDAQIAWRARSLAYSAACSGGTMQ